MDAEQVQNCRSAVDTVGVSHDEEAQSLAQLRLDMDELELRPYMDSAGAAQPALDAERAAAELGDDELRMRALLVQADVQGRQGHNVTAGRIAREVNRWAKEQNPPLAHVQARSHRILASFFERIQDLTTFLEHAMLAVELLPPDASTRLRIDHLMTLAVAQSRIPNLVSRACQGFADVEVLMAQINEPARHLMLVNNQAYTAYLAGDLAGASTAVNRLIALSASYEFDLDPVILDTVARIAAAQGRHDEAERYLLPLLDPNSPLTSGDPIAIPEGLLTLAEVQRQAGALHRAQVSLTRSREVSIQLGLKSMLVRTSREQADLYADAGRWQEAYTEAVSYIYQLHEQFAGEVVSRAEVMQAFFDSEQAQLATEQFRQMALRDPLTGLYNRRFIDDQLAQLLPARALNGTPVSVAFVDLDHFKRVNDECSHAVGDEVLRRVSGVLAEATPPEGFAGRMGGEEFLIVLPGGFREDILGVCERIQSALHAIDWSPVTGHLLVRASMGIATMKGEELTQAELLGLADQHLYAAKAQGRDRIIG